MTSDSTLNLSDFPDSPYARELGRERPRLRFEPELEESYWREQLLRMRPRIRYFALLTLILALVFGIEKLIRDGGISVAVAVHFLLLVPVVTCLLWLVLSRHYLDRFSTAIQFIAPLLGVLAVFLSAESMAWGTPEDLAVPPLVMVSIFVFMGLPYQAALRTAMIVLLGFLLSLWVFDIGQTLWLKSVLMAVASTGLATVIGKQVELDQRRHFLEGALIGELAKRDALTGLKNRRALDEHLERVWQQCLRESRPLAMLLVDIDHFKAYNDSYGHQAGDEALQRVAAVLAAVAQRPLDIAARYGGEEFAAILFDTPPDAARERARRLCQAVQEMAIPHRNSSCAPVLTVSVGVAAVTPVGARSPAGLLQLADEALYKAKDKGRNGYVLAGAEEYAALVTGEFHKH